MIFDSYVWPTTKGLEPVLDAEHVRDYLAQRLPIEWGTRVDERMKALNMRNAQLAVRAATTPQTISKLRSGTLIPRDYLKVMVAASLGTTVEALFPMPTTLQVSEAISKKPRRRPVMA